MGRRGRDADPAHGRPGLHGHRDEAEVLQVNLTLKIWRQTDAQDKGRIHTYEVDGISEDMSFLEMLDILNEQLNELGDEPIAFDSDCREGICVDRSAFDRIIQAGGYISANTGSAPEANSVPVPRDNAVRAFNVATCIGCGAC